MLDLLEPRGPCPMCGQAAHDIVVPYADIAIRRCRGCRFMYSDKVLGETALADYYSESFGGERIRHGQSVVARTNYLALATLLAPRPDMEILDVGAGYGFFLQQVRQHWATARVVGVEPSSEEATHAREVLGLDVRTGMLAAAGLARGRFDLVSSLEVIEHVVNPCEFLHEVRGYLKPRGALLIATDNFESTVVRQMAERWPKWIPHAHVSHFAPATLVSALKQCGFEIERSVSYTPWECWGIWLRDKLASRRTRRDPSRAYDLEESLQQEMHGRFRCLGLRRGLSPLWFRFTRRFNLDGEMMYVLARKAAG